MEFPFFPLDHKTNSGLRPRPLGWREGWNPGLNAGVLTVATREGMQTPSLFVLSYRHECLSLISYFTIHYRHLSTAYSGLKMLSNLLI